MDESIEYIVLRSFMTELLRTPISSRQLVAKLLHYA